MTNNPPATEGLAAGLAEFVLVPHKATPEIIAAMRDAENDLHEDISHPDRRMALVYAGAIAAWNRRAPASSGETGEPFQQRVHPWMMATFGPEISADKVERNHRFLEEALELVQSIGCTASEAHQLVDYVFGRLQGEVNQEVGGVMVTLAALCLANGIDMHQGGETELARIWTKVDQIRAKQAAKPAHSPLPAAIATPEQKPGMVTVSAAEPVGEEDNDLTPWLRSFGMENFREGSNALDYVDPVNGEWEDYFEVPMRVLRLIRSVTPSPQAIEARNAVIEDREAVRNELARREDAGHDARVPLTGPPEFARYSDDELRAALRSEPRP